MIPLTCPSSYSYQRLEIHPKLFLPLSADVRIQNPIDYSFIFFFSSRKLCLCSVFSLDLPSWVYHASSFPGDSLWYFIFKTCQEFTIFSQVRLTPVLTGWGDIYIKIPTLLLKPKQIFLFLGFPSPFSDTFLYFLTFILFKHCLFFTHRSNATSDKEASPIFFPNAHYFSPIPLKTSNCRTIFTREKA